MQCLENASLKARNTFGMEAKADRLWILHTREDEEEFLHSPWARQPFFILGSGANVLFTKDMHTSVVHLETRGVRTEAPEGGSVRLEVAAGENWDGFVRYCVDNGFYGVENLALIPSQVGSAVVQNIGAYGREVKDVVHAVKAWDIATGELKVFPKEACAFAYRSSLFKTAGSGKYLIHAVVFELSTRPQFHTAYGDVAERLRQRGGTTLGSVYEVISEIRREKLPDVRVLGSAGSFFKNPVVSPEKCQALQAAHPEFKAYPTDDGRMKLSAAQLIDSLGWKGRREGDVGVHERQALVIVNYGRATGGEVWRFAQRIQADVRQQYGLDLEPEVMVL